MVAGPHGLPDPNTTEFVLSQLRPYRRAARTICGYLGAIAAALDHFDGVGASLDERLATGVYYSTQEMKGFATLCQRGKRRLLTESKEAANRYSRFLEYVRWRASEFISRSSSDAGLDRAQKALKRFEVRAAAVAPQRDASIPSPDAKGGLTSSQRELLLDVIRPTSDRNPWQCSELRHRNFAMLSLSYELGPRAGDILSLKIRDLNLSHRPATVTFHRRHDDPEDPRRHQPVLKTKPRVLMISDALAETLEYWIDRVRSNRGVFPHSKTHPFLFTNGHGRPLSQRGYQYVFERLRQRFPELGNLTSHVFRYDWNERWISIVSIESGDPSAASREQCYAMGWSDRSSMPAKYARRAIAESANRRISRMHHAAQDRGRNYRGSTE